MYCTCIDVHIYLTHMTQKYRMLFANCCYRIQFHQVYITTEILQHAWLSWAAFSLVCCMTPLAYIGLNGMVAPLLLLPSAHSTEYTCTVAVHQDTLGSSRGGPPADFAKQASCSHWDRLAEQLSASSFRPSSKLRGVRREVTGASYTLAVTRFSFVRPLFRPPFFYPLKDNVLWWVVGYLWEHFWPLISGGRKCHKLKAMPSMVL